MKVRTVAALAAAVMFAACGTRLPDSAFVATGTQGVDTSTGDPLADGGSGQVTGDLPSSANASSAPTGSDTPSGSEGPNSGGGGNNGGGGTGPQGPTADGPNKASDTGVTENTITIGNITAENGVLGDAFAPSVRGMRAWAAAMNAAGGIHGRAVVLKTCDDREDRSRALECARRLVEQDKVFALVGTNTRAFGGAAQYLQDQAVPVLGFPITNSYYRYTHQWSVYPNGYVKDNKTVGYHGKVYNLSGTYRWFRTHVGVKKAAIFSYDIDESKQAGDFFATGAKKEGLAVTQYTVSFAAPSFDQAVADMQRQGIDIVLDSMDDGANRKLCDAMSRRNFTVKAKVSTVVVMGDGVGTQYNDTCRKAVYVVTESRPYSNTSVPSIAAFRQAFARYQPGYPLHQWALEAWVQGNLVKQALLQMGSAPTRKGLEDYFRSLRKDSVDGVMVGMDYHPIDYTKDRNEDCLSISKWNDSRKGWVEATDKFPFCYSDAFQYGTTAREQGN